MNKVLKDLPHWHSLLGWWYYIQQNWKWIPVPFTAGLWCRINHEIKEVSFLCQGSPIFGSCPQQYWHQTTTFQRLQLLSSWMPLKTLKQLRSFLGLVGYYHRFIKNFAHIAKPLMALTYHDAKFAWTSSHLAAFNTLKSALLETPILHYLDPAKCYILYMDPSDDSYGA